MSRSWLKLIGTAERPCRLDYSEEYADSRKPMRRVRPGDHMVLYAVGRQKQVFAIATVTSDVGNSGNGDWPYRVNLDYEVWLPVSAGVPIEQVSVERDLLRPIQRRHSCIELSEAEFERAENRLRAVARAAEAASESRGQELATGE